MTWLKNQQDGPTEKERAELLAQRESIVQRIKLLKAKPLPTTSQASIQGRQQDLLDLAKKITGIDRKLGRIK